MRSVQFAGLHRILHAVADAGHVRANSLTTLISERQLYVTLRGKPSNTTLYHCRNTLLQLGALKRRAAELSVAVDVPAVRSLLAEPPPRGRTLSPTAKTLFAELVLANDDCDKHFFSLFWNVATESTLQDFRRNATSVTWRPAVSGSVGTYELASEILKRRLVLVTPIQVRSILYGVRDWAAKQLDLIDEYSEPGRGCVMFPLRHPGLPLATDELLDCAVSHATKEAEWWTVSIRTLLAAACEQRGFSVQSLATAIKVLRTKYPGHIRLIATTESMTTITARTRKRAEFELSTAIRDARGRVISHLRIHNSINDGGTNGQD